MVTKRPHNRMNVIRHHAPRQQIISLAIEMAQSGSHHLSDLRVIQPSGAMATFQCLFHGFMIGFSEAIPGTFGERIIALVESLSLEIRPLFFERQIFVDRFLWDRVHQPKSDRIGRLVLGPVRESTL